jgi:predicted nucleotidyltransferase/DNA-binding XRE family transcriptional regulator
MDGAALLRRTRAVAGLSQAEAAERIGTSQPTLSAYESGARRITERTLRRAIAAIAAPPSAVVARFRDEIIAVCEKYGASDVRVFGSAARGDDTPESDIDLLVAYRPGVTLLDEVAMVNELEALTGKDVDVVSERGLRLPGDGHVIAEAKPL